MTAVQYRIARPTHQLKELVHFYQEIIGLQKIGSFENHEGYDGVMFALPGSNCHLEFTESENAMPCPAPSLDNLLVFYFDEPSQFQQAANRMAAGGCQPVAPENPYWKDKSLTYEDPDGWRIVFFNGTFTPTV